MDYLSRLQLNGLDNGVLGGRREQVALHHQSKDCNSVMLAFVCLDRAHLQRTMAPSHFPFMKVAMGAQRSAYQFRLDSPP